MPVNPCLGYTERAPSLRSRYTRGPHRTPEPLLGPVQESEAGPWLFSHINLSIVYQELTGPLETD